jgi:hypothetical protein
MSREWALLYVWMYAWVGLCRHLAIFLLNWSVRKIMSRGQFYNEN